MGLITLLTDFGLKDAYVGAMKGVVAGLAPGARVVDICHDIPPQDIRAGGLVWAQAVPYFPPGSVHVAVVDPGVGSRRKIVAAEARGSTFLAPDNGILGYVLTRREVRRAVEVKRSKHFLPSVSATFHGRDIFAPVAARLADGLPLEALGPAYRDYRLETLPRTRIRRRTLGGAKLTEAQGQVVYIDSFGNAVTNLRPLEASVLRELNAGSVRLPRLLRRYSQVKAGEALVLVGSSGYLEIAVNRGRAAEVLDLTVGEKVIALWK